MLRERVEPRRVMTWVVRLQLLGVRNSAEEVQLNRLIRLPGNKRPTRKPPSPGKLSIFRWSIFPRKTKSVKRFYKIHIYTWMYFYWAWCLPEQKYIAHACSACILIFSQIADTLLFRNFATSHVIVDNGNMKCFYLRCSLLTVQMTTINRESKQMNVTLQVITLFLQKPTLLLKHTKLVAF